MRVISKFFFIHINSFCFFFFFFSFDLLLFCNRDVIIFDWWIKGEKKEINKEGAVYVEDLNLMRKKKKKCRGTTCPQS